MKLATSLAIMRPHISLAQTPETGTLKADLKRTDVVNATQWGYQPTSATNALQGAINSGAPKVFVPNMGSPWIVDPIFLKSNQEIEFEDGVILLAKKGSYRGQTECLMEAVNKENITLRGTGAVFRMQQEDYKKWNYKKSEWRNCLSLRGCRNISVHGLTFEESGGDGIYIGRGVGNKGRVYCENIEIKDVTCNRNHRQGISVISVRGLTIEGCLLCNTEGTSPQAGLDYEPNYSDEYLQNCVLRNTILEGNKSYGLLLVLNKLNENSASISMIIEHCQIRQRGEIALRIIHSEPRNSPFGAIQFNDNQIEGSCIVDYLANVQLVL